MASTQFSCMTARRIAALAGACAMLAASPALAAPTTPQPDGGAPVTPAAGEPTHFKGAVALPGTSLEFTVRLVRGLDGTPTGTIDIPMQSVRGFELSSVVWTPEQIAFAMQLPGQPERNWPRFEFPAAAESGVHAGVLRQAGAEFETTLEPLAEAPTPPPRPQHPVAPFPYTTRDVELENPEGGTLAGTLVVPEGDGPFPCAVLITGSGPQDRDETLFEHKPFWVIADDLARHGIASLRCDDRGVGGSDAGDLSDDSLDLATDVRAMVEFLRAQPEVDATRVGLIGHSEGGLIGPLVAAEDPGVSFLVMLAGPGVPGDEILIRQSEAMAAAMGVSADDLAAQRPLRIALFEAVQEGDMETAHASLSELLRLADPTSFGGEDDQESLKMAVTQQMRALASQWMRTFMALDPREALRSVDCPVLVLNGDLDLQVLHDQNVPEVERALREGGNDRVEVHVLPGLNHLFQPATTGAMTEYATIETTFDPEALRIMREWIARVVQP